MYKITLNNIGKQPAKVTDDMECAIYHHKHTFVTCTILKDIDYLYKHFIQYCILMNRTRKQMVASVNYIDASWATDNGNTDKSFCALDYLHANTDNDADFQEGEEHI